MILNPMVSYLNMLKNLGGKVEDMHEHLTNLSKEKETTEKNEIEI